LLIARTMFGVRSVDLNRLRSIRMWRALNNATSAIPNRLYVTDANRVRLSMPGHDECAARALRHAVEHRGNSDVRLSQGARGVLGIDACRTSVGACRDYPWFLLTVALWLVQALAAVAVVAAVAAR
jgi:hypothetical protein